MHDLFINASGGINQFVVQTVLITVDQQLWSVVAVRGENEWSGRQRDQEQQHGCDPWGYGADPLPLRALSCRAARSDRD